jgi:DNA-binding MarR family transcriptional regulator
MTSRDTRAAFPLEPPLDFLQHLWQLNHALERRSVQMQRTLGVTAQQRLFLRCVGKYPGMTAGTLAEVLHVDRGTVSVALGRLNKLGLVTRRPDPRDGRRTSLGLSARGRALTGPSEETVEHAVERVLGRARPADVKRVKAMLRQLAEELAGAPADRGPVARPRPGRPARGRRRSQALRA